MASKSKRGRGRPKIAVRQKRTILISTRVNAAEAKIIRLRAKQHGVQVATLVRNLATKGSNK